MQQRTDIWVNFPKYEHVSMISCCRWLLAGPALIWDLRIQVPGDTGECRSKNAMVHHGVWMRQQVSALKR